MIETSKWIISNRNIKLPPAPPPWKLFGQIWTISGQIWKYSGKLEKENLFWSH